MNFAKYITFGMIFFVCSASANTVIDKLNDLALNTNPPTVYQQQTLSDGFQSLYFDGVPYQGKATRIFAYYNKPKGEGPFPAMVLVHGGGGSAFKTWVKKWNDAGFAAISIAVEGQTGTQINKKPPNKWQKHQWGGPSRQGIYKDSDKPLIEQWMYHASSAVIRAHNLLRSFDEIKQDQIGLSGISWGGVITSTVIGFDQRFAFAIPIYGSGHLAAMDNQYADALENNDIYHNVWEPALRIEQFNKPTFWLTGLKESHFSLDAQANTYKLLNNHYQSIQPTLKHNHTAGWTPKEPYLFAQSVIARSVIGGDEVPSFFMQTLIDDSVSIKVKITNSINTATLYYTNDTGHTFNRVWHQVSAQIASRDNQSALTAILPLTASAWFFNIKTNGLIYSSEFSQRVIK